jgi:uncharacterized 2Fe-2S/4Fe-4S cluster protein (DUF4445 family)
MEVVMNFQVKIVTPDRVAECHSAPGVGLRLLLQQHDFEIDTPCNGYGTCGKCKVRINCGVLPDATAAERRIFDPSELAAGYRLACQITIDRDMEVFLENHAISAQIATGVHLKEFPLAPGFSKRLITIVPASLEDQRPDSQRLSSTLALENEISELDLLRQLPEVLHSASHTPSAAGDGTKNQLSPVNCPLSTDLTATLFYYRDKLTGVEPGDTTASLFGIAVDIGTTTLAAYLFNLITGQRLATYSCLNPQKKYGADVISRIQHTLETSSGLDELHDTLIDGINLAARELAASAGIPCSAINAVSFAGNTTMIHFLLKLPPQNIAVAPFIPVTTQALTIKAADLGLRLNRNAVAIIIPSVAAYIGADTVAAVLASGMDKQDEPALLIDFGTNGEIVLGNRERMLACSAAAGPAFEGAGIRDGVGGIRGAIDGFSLTPQPAYTTIGGTKPIGICGSGLIDILAELNRAGIIDETGRLESDPRILSSFRPELTERLTKIEGMAAWVVAYREESANSRDIVVTQKDIREFQNAKAAIAAGIKVLAKEAGLKFPDIKRVYLAGGFGNYIRTASALDLGLIPAGLRGRIEPIGNAAGAGAIAVLLSAEALDLAKTVRDRIKYLELSASRTFNDFFVDSMFFGEE